MTATQQVDGPLISVLIPAYNFPAGVRRALDSLGPGLSRPGIEVVVSDDSTRPEHSSAIRQLASERGNVCYRHNAVPFGAVPNWNDLLRNARGQYCLLLHHDEYFESPAVFEDVLRCLAGSAAPDGIVLPCKVIGRSGRARRNMPVVVAEFVVTRWPGYLFRRNVLGAPSVLVFRRSMYEAFDERLRWLVDVELYARVVTRYRPRLVFFRAAGVVSDLSLPTSITTTLRGEIGAIRQRELALLRQSGALVGRGAWLVSDGPLSWVARVGERIAWSLFRGILRAIQEFWLALTRAKRVPSSQD